jgi:hypothetical protein
MLFYQPLSGRFSVLKAEWGGRNSSDMIRIAITTAAFEAILATMPLGSATRRNA